MSLEMTKTGITGRKQQPALNALALALLACACTPQRTAQTVAQTGNADRVAGAHRASALPAGPTRTETDLLGAKEIPVHAYYGVQTARALENFQISGLPINHYP
jgi:aspartate ammonia-lyase